LNHPEIVMYGSTSYESTLVQLDQLSHEGCQPKG
jgi:hypothetical protein